MEHYRVDSASGKIWRFSYFNPASDRVRWYRIVIQPYTYRTALFIVALSAGILSAIPVLAKITGMLARRAYGQPALIKEKKVAENAKGSPERFGYSWTRFSELTPEQEQQFLMWMADLPMEKDWAGTRFLDVGCGAGRNSYWAMKHGATSGVACDLDERSLAAARVNLEEFPTVDVRSVSVYDLPFKNEFDIAFSIGVIHHLDDPVCAVRD